MTEQEKDLCKKCEHYWLDFPLPCDHYEPHCEILDRMSCKPMDDVVPYPCDECPFGSYSKKK